MTKLIVKGSKKYFVVIYDDFSFLKEEVSKVFNGNKILIVTDKNVYKLFGEIVKKQLKDYQTLFYVLEAGEKSKNAENFISINQFLAENSFNRKDLVISLGGGVCGDLTGFVASTYMRGINFIQCPTTLLADVDSSIGGKTAIDLKQGKNLVGAFYQPSLVYISLSTLKNLPEKEITNGMGEVVKYAFLSKSVSKKMILERDYEKLIIACLKIKRNIVTKDELESGKRKLLNLGHTVGHAIESLSEYSLPHGLCVAKGLKKIISASAKFYNLNEIVINKLEDLICAYPFDLSTIYNDQEITDKIYNDKKSMADSVDAIMIKDVGKVEIVKIKISELGGLISEK